MVIKPQNSVTVPVIVKQPEIKTQIHSNYCTLNMRVYAPFFLLCLNLGNSQIEGIIDSCNYEKIVKQDYWLMLHIEHSSHSL